MKLNVLPSDAPWYAQGLKFECTCCGNCCSGGPGYVWMTEEEVQRLADHLGLSYKETFEKYCRHIGQKISLKELRTRHGTYDCIFLTELEPQKKDGEVAHPRRVCGIYAVRPLQCRTWPFWEGNMESREDWDRASRRCPGMNRGKTYTREQIEQLRDAEEWPKEAAEGKRSGKGGRKKSKAR